jgi:hypothetical protein
VRRSKFPELESLVHHAIDYARVVKAIGNEMDVTLVNLDDILPQARVSACFGAPLLHGLCLALPGFAPCCCIRDAAFGAHFLER